MFIKPCVGTRELGALETEIDPLFIGAQTDPAIFKELTYLVPATLAFG